MKKLSLFLFSLFFLSSCNNALSNLKDADSLIIPQDNSSGLRSTNDGQKGFFDIHWDEEKGNLLLAIEDFDTEFLYVNSLAAGVGSNDIGLDRGQLGSERVVKFVKVGPKVLLTQINYDYRAISDNEACLLYTSPSPRDATLSRMPSSA